MDIIQGESRKKGGGEGGWSQMGWSPGLRAGWALYQAEEPGVCLMLTTPTHCSRNTDVRSGAAADQTRTCTSMCRARVMYLSSSTLLGTPVRTAIACAAF